MLKNRIKKGSHGYLSFKKKEVLIQTLIMFGVSLVIFICGYLYKGTKANILSVVAVLGLLPASKSLVSFIMYMRTPKFKEEIYLELKDFVEANEGLFENYFTTYKKNYSVTALFCKKDCIIGYTEFSDTDLKALEEHITDILKQNSYKDITVKIFTDKNKFLERAEKLSDQQSSEALTKLMGEITL